LRLTSEVILLTIVFTTIIIINPLIIIILLIFILLIFVFYKFSKNKTFEYGKIGTKSNENIIRLINQSMGNIKITKIHLLEDFFINDVAENTKNIKYATSKFWAFLIVPKLVIETILIISIASMVIVFLNKGYSSSEIVALLSMIGIASLRLMPSINNITNSISAIRHGNIVIDKLYNDLQSLNNMYIKKSSSKLINFEKSISLHNINYRYNKSDELVLNNINLSIKKGESIGFIGKSGAGKSTLIDIILGLIEHSRGNIMIDGINIDTNDEHWKKILAYVPQQIFLIDDSIKNNIAFGIDENNIDSIKIDKILKMVNLDVLIEELTDGIETIIGENGVRLSGGQRQRIGIARALYKDPQILIFDEATSALDTDTEKVVTDAIDKLGDSKTMIIVAHRIDTLKKCDTIYELANGKIVWNGNYKELVLRNEIVK
jgi:ATP-binding cassette, subfamily B, bacterial PglK